MNTNKYIILKTLRENKDTIKSYGVAKIGLFGSYARGGEDNKSDIDFIVIFEKGKKTFDNFMDLCFLLENIFNRKVDVLTPEGIKTLLPSLEDEIIYENVS